MEKCESCKKNDKEKSNKNWVVCSEMPLNVIMNKTSKNCEKYESYQ